MTTITEDYVSFETAKLLREKGFDCRCACINHPQYGMSLIGHIINNTDLQLTREYELCIDKENLLTIPTLQMTMKWLREVHNIHIELNWEKGNQLYSFQIWKPGKFRPEISSLDLWRIYKDDNYLGEWVYEEACEAAIKYCLENLI